MLPVTAIPPPATPPREPVVPAGKRRSLDLEVLAVAVVIVIAGIAFAVLATRGDDASPAAVPEPSNAVSPSPGSSATSSPATQSPEVSPTAGEGQALSIEGIDLRLTSATRRDQYVSGDQTFTPGDPADTFLIIRGTFEGDSDRLLEFVVSVVDENGRRDVPSVTVTDVNLTEGQGEGDVEWVFAVSGTSSSFTFDLPEGNSVDVTPLLGSA